MKYILTLYEGLTEKELLVTNDRHLAEDMLEEQWRKITGNQWLRLTDGFGSSTREALIDKPLNDWENDRIELLKNQKFDIKRNGDATLLIRGLIEEVEINNRLNVLLRQ